MTPLRRASCPARPRTAVAALVVLTTLTACTGSPRESSTPGPTTPPEHATWSYSGATGPERWGELSPEWSECSRGVQQSPIDLVAPSPGPGEALGLEWGVVDFATDDEGHGVHVEVDGPATLMLDGTVFELLQFHAHTPSEHTVDGRATDAEAHFVHRSNDGRLAVVGVLIDEGAENTAWADVVHHIGARELEGETDETDEPDATGEQDETDGGTLELASLLPADLGHVEYDGSLTTPPCTEGVSWIVLTDPIEMSPEQIAVLHDGHDSARPTQPLGDRVVTGTTAQG